MSVNLDELQRLIDRLRIGFGTAAGHRAQVAAYRRASHEAVDALIALRDEVIALRQRTVYVAVDVGCIECGEESRVLGVFSNKDSAEQVMAEAEKGQNAAWFGQHEFFVAEKQIDAALAGGEHD